MPDQDSPELASEMPAGGGEFEARGSEALLRQRLAGQPFDEEQLSRLIGLLQREGVRIRYWFPLGTPWPEILYGTLQVSPEVLGGLTTELFGMDDISMVNFDVFPLGIPVIDELIVRFGSTPAFRR